jgi:hypothetical protein
MTPQHPSQHDDFDNPSGDAEELDQALEDDLWFGPRGPTRPVSPGRPDGSARWTTGCAEAQMDGGTGSR